MGRVPVVVSLDELDKETLVRILREPKNAIIKQYQKMFELDGVDLEFEDAAIEAVADKSIEEKDRSQRSACYPGKSHDGYDVQHSV